MPETDQQEKISIAASNKNIKMAVVTLFWCGGSSLLTILDLVNFKKQPGCTALTVVL